MEVAQEAGWVLVEWVGRMGHRQQFLVRRGSLADVQKTVAQGRLGLPPLPPNRLHHHGIDVRPRVCAWRVATSKRSGGGGAGWQEGPVRQALARVCRLDVALLCGLRTSWRKVGGRLGQQPLPPD